MRSRAAHRRSSVGSTDPRASPEGSLPACRSSLRPKLFVHRTAPLSSRTEAAMGSITWKLIAVFLQAFGEAAVDFLSAWLRQRQQEAHDDRVAVEVAAARTAQD